MLFITFVLILMAFFFGGKNKIQFFLEVFEVVIVMVLITGKSDIHS